MEPKTELQRNAITEARKKELELFQRALDIQWLNSRMEDGRMGRCLALIKREAEMEKDFQERTDHAAIVNKRAAQETALGVEIANIQREGLCSLVRRHYLHQRDPELRELAKKLQAGYVCRDLQQQILNNQYRKLQEKNDEKQAITFVQNSMYNDFEAKEKEEKEKIERTTQYCKELQQQLVNRQLQKQCHYEDSLIEKKMLEDITRTIADEDHRELKQKRDLMERTRNEMETFQKAREAWKEKQKQLVVIEEKQIEEQSKLASNRNAVVVAERERKLKVKEDINQKIATKVLAHEAERQERDHVIKLLQEHEFLEKNVQDGIKEKLKADRMRKDTMETLTEQMETKKRVQREIKEKEVLFRKECEVKMAEEDVKELEKQLKKREREKLYSQDLLKQMQENALKRKNQVKMEQERVDYVWDCDREWREEVEEERKKMIEKHVPPLLGYLQAGVVQKEDLPVVRKGANKQENLRKLDIESLNKSVRPHQFSKCNAQCRILRKF